MRPSTERSSGRDRASLLWTSSVCITTLGASLVVFPSSLFHLLSYITTVSLLVPLYARRMPSQCACRARDVPREHARHPHRSSVHDTQATTDSRDSQLGSQSRPAAHTWGAAPPAPVGPTSPQRATTLPRRRGSPGPARRGPFAEGAARQDLTHPPQPPHGRRRAAQDRPPQAQTPVPLPPTTDTKPHADVHVGQTL